MNKEVTVSGFTDSLGNLTKVPVVQAAVIYDCPYTGKELVIHINNALYIKDMSINLVPPFMMRLCGINVDECPKFLAEAPSENNHSIFFPELNFRIPLSIDRTISYIPTRCPTDQEMCDIKEYVDLTPDTDDWNPDDPSFASQEGSMIDFRGEIHMRKIKRQKLHLHSESHGKVYDNEDTLGISAILSNISNTLSIGAFGTTIDNVYNMSSVMSGEKRYSTDIDDIARIFQCSKNVAQRTLQVTTQRCVRVSSNPSLSRRYNTNDRMLRYNRLSCDMFMDTFFSSVASIRGYKMAQLFVSDFNFLHVQNMKRRAELPFALKSMFKGVGVPAGIVADGAREQVQGESLRLCQQAGCTVKELEKDTPWSNRAELFIGLGKNGMLRAMKKAASPMKLWCYCNEWYAKVNNVLAKDTYQLHGQTPYFKATGIAADISSLCEFEWYEWIYFRDHASKFPYAKERLGRYLGPADHAGTMMSKWILNENGKVLPYQTIRKLTKSEVISPVEIERRKIFSKEIEKKLGGTFNDEDGSEPELDDLYVDDIENGHNSSMPEADDIETYDEYINSEVLLPREGEHMQVARILKRSTNDNGALIGNANKNPILDTRVYDVMYPDGAVEQFTANTIAENIFSQVDDEGFRYQLLDEIVDHKSTQHALQNNTKGTTRKYTTKGWFLLIKWKDGSESWKPLCDLKEAYPVETAIYAKNNELQNEPAFNWWVPYTLKKSKRIIMAVKARMVDKSHKFGIRIPRNVREAYEIDKINNNSFWADAIKKEMKNVSVAFEFLEEGKDPPQGYQFMPCRLIFDVKMDFTRKARYVAQGCFVDSSFSGSTYAGVVSRESVRIAFVYAALHDLDIMAGDIQNAYLQAPTTGKHWTVAGPEFGSFQGRKMIIVRALYGTNTAGRDFRNHLRECMVHLDYTSCEADHDVWMRKSRRHDGTYYYEYLLLYTDDCLCISEYPKEALLQIDKYFKLKESSIGPPKIYLGGKVGKVQLSNGVWSYSFSSSQYVKEAVRNVESYLTKQNMKLARKATAPFTYEYRPELDQSPELSPKEANYFQSLIGVLRWAVELGRIDIATEVSMLSSFLAMPRDGHLQQVFHIFAYLKQHHNSRIVFDPTYPDLEYEKFERNEWKNFYGDMKEEIPDNIPEPLGKEFIISCYVDADHAGDKITRRSRTGYAVLLNSAPIYWYSKRQNCIETSSFGSEFVAMKQACEYLRGLRFKLRMMGIPVNDPCFILGDNKSVLVNSSVPESTLKKKSNSIAYHFVRAGTACDEWRFNYIPSKDNPGDILASSRSNGLDRKRKVSLLMYDIYD